MRMRIDVDNDTFLSSEVRIIRLPSFRVRAELIDQSASKNRQEYFTFVIIPHGAAQLLVSHLRVSLPGTPSLRDLVASHESELGLGIVFPANETRACLSVAKEIANEFPKFALTRRAFLLFQYSRSSGLPFCRNFDAIVRFCIGNVVGADLCRFILGSDRDWIEAREVWKQIGKSLRVQHIVKSVAVNGIVGEKRLSRHFNEIVSRDGETVLNRTVRLIHVRRGRHQPIDRIFLGPVFDGFAGPSISINSLCSIVAERTFFPCILENPSRGAVFISSYNRVHVEEKVIIFIPRLRSAHRQVGLHRVVPIVISEGAHAYYYFFNVTLRLSRIIIRF